MRRGPNRPRLCSRHCVADRPDAVALRWKAATAGASGRGASTPTGRAGSPPVSPRLGVGRGDRVVLMMRNRPEFHVADIAVAAPRGDADLDLQLLGARAGPVPRRPLPGPCSRSSRTTTTSTRLLERARRAPGGSRRSSSIDGDPPDGVHRFADVARGPIRSTWRRRGDDRAARRPRDRHLHVGHDRAAQGRDARPLERVLDGREPPARVRRSRSDRLAARVVPADGAHRRADGVALPGHRLRLRGDDVSRGGRRSRSTSPRSARSSCSRVPRVWEKVYAGVQAVLAADPDARSAVPARARSRCRGRRVPTPGASRRPGRRWPRASSRPRRRCSRPVRELLGLDQVESAISGAAPLPVEILALLPRARASSCPRSTGSPRRPAR